MESMEKMESLARVVGMINSSLDLDKTLQAILESVTLATHAVASSLMMLDSNSEWLIFRASTGGRTKEIKQYKIQANQGIAGWVIQNGKSALVKDALTDPRHARAFAQKVDFLVQSMIAVPIKDGQKTIGVLEILNCASGGKTAFDEEDLRFAEILTPHIANALKNARAYTKLNQETEDLRRMNAMKRAIVGKHPDVAHAIELVRKIAPFDATVLICGESGTGKELFARAIHENSKRVDGPFVAVNCAAMPEALLESELFGHEKSSFTGALATRLGKCELAQGGTLFLDEIGDMSLSAQEKILRAIETKIFQRVGGYKDIAVDTRVVCATNKNLKKEVQDKRFREDLYYRINECPIYLPSLRSRKEDIPELVENFLREFSAQFGKKITGAAKEAMQLLLAHDWPGNVRQLRNVLKSTVLLSQGATVQIADLPDEIRLKDAKAFLSHGAGTSLEQMEKSYILSVLTDTGWNKSQAAKTLNISRPTLNKKIKDYHLDQNA